MTKNYYQIAAIILASGTSKRMGKPKQLLPYNGMSLLEHSVRKVLLSPFQEVVAVIGHEQELIKKSVFIEEPRFKWMYNQHYYEGQSAALKLTMNKLKKYNGVMIFLADQPLINSDTITFVLNKALQLLPSVEGGLVVQPSYQGQKGHPVFFSQHLFSQFQQLSGDEGGKRIINLASHHEIVPVDDRGIIIDIDTPEDYEELKSKFF